MLTKATKAKMQRYYQAYCKSTHSSIERVYAKPSQTKIEAFERCKSMSRNMSGSDPYILTYNTFCFTVGFFAPHPEISETVFIVVTPENVYYIPETELE